MLKQELAFIEFLNRYKNSFDCSQIEVNANCEINVRIFQISCIQNLKTI